MVTTPPHSIPFWDARTVHAGLPLPDLIHALERAFAQEINTPLRHAHTVCTEEGARLLLMPAWRQGGAMAVKVVTVFPGNRARAVSTVGATVLLLDGQTGHPRAVLDGESLTLLRTGAASALASRYLSRADSATLLIVGAGQLAPYMARAHATVRTFGQVLVWARRSEAALELAESLRREGLPATAASDLAHAVRQADVISCATTSREPLIRFDWLKPGTHVDLVGGFTRDMREVDDQTVVRAAVFVDTRNGALTEAGDLTQPLERGLIDPAHVCAELAGLARGLHPGRHDASQITLFKSVGTALEDLAAAELLAARML